MFRGRLGFLWRLRIFLGQCVLNLQKILKVANKDEIMNNGIILNYKENFSNYLPNAIQRINRPVHNDNLSYNVLLSPHGRFKH